MLTIHKGKFYKDNKEISLEYLACLLLDKSNDIKHEINLKPIL